MYKVTFIIIVLSPFFILFIFDDYQYSNTRKVDSMERRMAIDSYTSLAKKSVYIKEAISNVMKRGQSPGFGNVGYEMNRLEAQYMLPYSWGGDVNDFQKGLDCTGFVHGMMYYLGHDAYIKRFNTHSLYKKFLRDKGYELLYSSNVNSIEGFNLSKLKLGDVVIWPSGIQDAKNLPTETTFGHIGVVSNIINNSPYITHFVSSAAYDNIDIFQNKGPGINTLDAFTFITLKKRGVLAIFRARDNV